MLALSLMGVVVLRGGGDAQGGNAVAIPAHLFPAGGSGPGAQKPGCQLLSAMLLLLCVSVVAASALAAPAPGTSGKGRGAARERPEAPNVVLVVSDSFVSTERGRRGGAPVPDPLPAHSLSCAAGVGEQKLANLGNLQTCFTLKKSKKCIVS